LATGVGQRDSVHANRGVARIAIRPCCKRNSPAQPPPAAVSGRAGAAQSATQAIQRGLEGAPPRQRSLGGNSRAARAHPGFGRVRPNRRSCRTRPWRILDQLESASAANLIMAPSHASVGERKKSKKIVKKKKALLHLPATRQ